MVTPLTAVCVVLGSNPAVGGCIYRESHCDIQPCTWVQVIWVGLRVGGCLAPVYSNHVNWVNFCDGCAMVTAPYTYPSSLSSSSLLQTDWLTSWETYNMRIRMFHRLHSATSRRTVSHSQCDSESLYIITGWLRGTVVERRSLTGKLSLSRAWTVADGWPLMWVNRPL